MTSAYGSGRASGSVHFGFLVVVAAVSLLPTAASAILCSTEDSVESVVRAILAAEAVPVNCQVKL